MGYQQLSNVLWRHRQLLELLVFKLETMQSLMTTGHTRWIARATREMEGVADEMRTNALALVAESEAAARQLGLPESSGLRALAEAAPQPWDDLLAQHHSALLDLTGQVQQVSATNAEMLNAGRISTQETMLAAADAPGTYDPTGRTDTSALGATPQLIDQAL